MMWGQPPPTYNTADPWYDGAANYDYGAGQEVEQRWAVLDGALNSYLGGQDVLPPPPAPQSQQPQSWDEQAAKHLFEAIRDHVSALRFDFGTTLSSI